MGTKIGILRREFLRIGGTRAADQLTPPLSVGWHYTRVIVRGKHRATFDYDMLREVLMTIPDGAGEDFFWNRIDATDFTALANRLNQEMIEAWRKKRAFQVISPLKPSPK